MITAEEINGFKKIEIIERPEDKDAFENDIKNSEEGELKEKDTFERWAVYLEKNVLKVCVYPYAFTEED